MPFQDSVYYPYTADVHSSGGTPSLLSSPLGHQQSAPPQSMTPSSGAAPALHPFKFRPRRESVDWRRLNAVDIDLVVNQLDVDALQEYISLVTFCSLEGERCQRCQSPMDPALVKLLQLAQLTVEWLLHCQDILMVNLRAAEERLAAAGHEREQLLAAAGREREQLLAQQKKQEDSLKSMSTELKSRMKIIRTQQSLFAPRLINSQKCAHCEKTFINASYMQNHMQRRHPDQYETQRRLDGEKKCELDVVKQELSSLKEQMVQCQENLRAKNAQNLVLSRRLDEYELQVRADNAKKSEMDGLKLEINSLKEQIAQQQHAATLHEREQSLHADVLRELERFKAKDVEQILEQQRVKQDKKWESRLQKMKVHHTSEKNQMQSELSRLQQTASEQQELSQRLQQEMDRKLQEKEQTIRAQREKIKNISSHPPSKAVEAPVLVSAAPPDPKPKRVTLEEPVSAPQLDPIEELSEEDRDSSSISERRPVERKPAPEKKQRTSTPRRNPNKKEIRRGLEQAMEKKLENLGIKPHQKGLKVKEFNTVLAKVKTKRDNAAKALPDFWRSRENISCSVEERLVRHRSSSIPSPESLPRSRRSVQALQIRPRSSSLPSRATQVMSGPVKQPKTPQPAPRTSTPQVRTSTPNARNSKRTFMPPTSTFSSDEDSEEEEEEEEEQQPPPQRHHSVKPSHTRLNPTTAAGVQVRPAAAAVVPTGHLFCSRVSKTVVTKMESEEEEEEEDEEEEEEEVVEAGEEEEEEEWSDVSELQEIDPRQLTNATVDKRSSGKESKITELARRLEQQVADRGGRKPVGGVSVLPHRRDDVQDLPFIDLEDGSDHLLSSSEDKKSKPAQSSSALRKSLDSASTSAWGTSTGKPPRSGLTGTGSTLKSSLCSLDDCSDADEVSN